jgi:hypothetical protein
LGSRGVAKTLESSLEVKGWRGLWGSTSVDIWWDMEGEAREIGGFNMAEADEESKRFGVEEADERL